MERPMAQVERAALEEEVGCSTCEEGSAWLVPGEAAICGVCGAWIRYGGAHAS